MCGLSPQTPPFFPDTAGWTSDAICSVIRARLRLCLPAFAVVLLPLPLGSWALPWRVFRPRPQCWPQHSLQPG